MDKNSNFKPYIPADKIVPEFTVTSVLIGLILAVVFGECLSGTDCRHDSLRFHSGGRYLNGYHPCDSPQGFHS